MSQGGLNSLATIIKRLEAATSRLEDIALASSESAPSESIAVSSAAAPPPPPPPPAAESDKIQRSVEAFDEDVIEVTLKPFVEFTKSFAGPLVIDQITILDKEFTSLRSILLLASACTKPDDNTFKEILSPLQTGIEDIIRIKNSKRSEWDNHLAMIAEGNQAVAWVTIAPKPGPFIGEIKDSAQFYGNRIIKELREKDPKHAQWVRGYVTIIEALRKYVMEFHATGLVWNAMGVSAAHYKPPPATVAASGPPPPPPPPPPIDLSAQPDTAGGAAAVFAELNRGEEVTKGLRKVDKSEMTHKNPDLRARGTVLGSTTITSKRPMKPSKPQSLAGKKPSKFALEGNKWAIEYYENDSSVVVDKAELNHTVNLFGCKNVTVQIKGKVNAVTLVNCTKTAVLVESVIASISITSSPSFALQVTGSAPTIQLDSTDSGQIYLSRDCLGVEITTAKCSSINVNIPIEGEEEGVFNEKAVPEMLRTVIKDGKLITGIVEHSA